MTEYRKRSTRSVITSEEFPYNLLTAIKAQTELVPPSTMTADRTRGLQYALSTLEPREYEILMFRYADCLSLPEIGGHFDRSPERIRQIEQKALRKLRMPSRWNYIKLGVAGYWQFRKKSYYDQGYTHGYKAGYEMGRKDERTGREQAYEDNPDMNLTIENLNLSTRAYQCLRKLVCHKIGDVAQKEADDIWRTRNMGKKTADEIAQALRNHGIYNTDWDQFILPK